MTPEDLKRQNDEFIRQTQQSNTIKTVAFIAGAALLVHLLSRK